MNIRKKPVDSDLKKLNAMVNPFVVSDFVIEVNKIVLDGQYRRDKNSGEYLAAMFPHEIDAATRIYINSDVRISVGSLSASAKSLLLFLIFELESGKDWVWINRDRFCKENGLKDDRTYRNAVDELVRYCFIAFAFYMDTFWVNPKIMFCGSRKKKYPKKIVVRYGEDVGMTVQEPEVQYGDNEVGDVLRVTNDEQEVYNITPPAVDLDAAEQQLSEEEWYEQNLKLMNETNS